MIRLFRPKPEEVRHRALALTWTQCGCQLKNNDGFDLTSGEKNGFLASVARPCFCHVEKNIEVELSEDVIGASVWIALVWTSPFLSTVGASIIWVNARREFDENVLVHLLQIDKLVKAEEAPTAGTTALSLLEGLKSKTPRAVLRAKWSAVDFLPTQCRWAQFVPCTAHYSSISRNHRDGLSCCTCGQLSIESEKRLWLRGKIMRCTIAFTLLIIFPLSEILGQQE